MAYHCHGRFTNSAEEQVARHEEDRLAEKKHIPAFDTTDLEAYQHPLSWPRAHKVSGKRQT